MAQVMGMFLLMVAGGFALDGYANAHDATYEFGRMFALIFILVFIGLLLTTKGSKK